MFKKIGAAALIGLFIACMFFAPGAYSTTATNVSGDMATGTITSTGAAVNVSLGWTPKSVVISKTSNTLVRAEWDSTMPDASCVKIVSGMTGTSPVNAGLLSYATTSCITPYAGSSTAGKGFTLGTDSDINTANSDTLRYKAFR